MIPALAFFGLLASGAEAEPRIWCTPPRQTVEWTGWGMLVVRWEPECVTRSAKERTR
jgi:hypothetical protein